MKLNTQHRTCIRGGRLFDPSQSLDDIQDLFIENDRIVAIGNAPSDFVVDQTIDAAGQMVVPGFIDLCAFLAEPGYGQKGNITSETAAAVRAGITTLCCTPNTRPVVDSPAVAALIRDKAQSAGYANVLPLGALTPNLKGEQIANLFGLKEAGCVAMTNLDFPMKDSRVIRQCYLYAASYNIPVFATPLDSALADGGCLHEGFTSSRLGLAGISETAETLALAQHLLLAEQTGVRLHISRITAARSLEMLRDARKRGLDVTADVAIGNLCFIDEDAVGYDSLIHVNPVYRSESDRQALLSAVNKNELAICSNHRPHEMAAKMAPFAATESGISVLDSFTAVLFDLVENNALTLKAAVQAVTDLPAQILRKPLGQLNIGGPADLAIIQNRGGYSLGAETMASMGKNSPWTSHQFSHRVSHTLLGGRLVYQA